MGYAPYILMGVIVPTDESGTTTFINSRLLYDYMEVGATKRVEYSPGELSQDLSRRRIGVERPSLGSCSTFVAHAENGRTKTLDRGSSFAQCRRQQLNYPCPKLTVVEISHGTAAQGIPGADNQIFMERSKDAVSNLVQHIIRNSLDLCIHQRRHSFS